MSRLLFQQKSAPKPYIRAGALPCIHFWFHVPSMSSQQLSPTRVISSVNDAIRCLFPKAKKKKTGEHGSSLHDNSTGEDHKCVPINSLSDDILLEIFNRCRLSAINSLSDDVLLDISNRHRLFFFPNGLIVDTWDWHRLTHVCRRWRYLIFASPRRLDLRFLCTYGTPVRRALDYWPALPISIQYGEVRKRTSLTLKDEDNIIAALEHPARTSKIQLALTNSLFDKLSALKQQPFPALEHFLLISRGGGKLSALPSTILCESAPRLRVLFFDRIPFPMLPKLLLSTKDLVLLQLMMIPSSGYFSPESLVTSLSGMTQLKTLYIEFASPSSRPNRRSVPPLRRAVLSTLTQFTFRGISEYLEDVVAGIDAPALGYFNVKLFNQLMFDVPQLHQFISRAEKLRGFGRVTLDSSKNGVSITLAQPGGADTRGPLSLQIACKPLDWQVSSMAEICNQCSNLFSRVEELKIRAYFLQPARQEEIGVLEWLELFRPFTTVSSLYVSEFLGPLVAAVLEDAADGPVMEVLPALRLLRFEDSRESVPVDKFVTARRPTLNVHYGDLRTAQSSLGARLLSYVRSL
ncbi:hypothetical protein B0F90DRAFT_1919333 [Multifurca ochricompacta]|uniref:F-box domain-containing protein n=1 Tax=Multifurca ochricompacta TaxID=376703 RepID=A0AAD4LYV3_9AGAM|nr:hypothetical protein B0F90DRAFT_1919333 [Multifurca ochricompacta]